MFDFFFFWIRFDSTDLIAWTLIISLTILIRLLFAISKVKLNLLGETDIFSIAIKENTSMLLDFIYFFLILFYF